MPTVVEQPTLTTTDRGRAERFYTQVLGFRLAASRADRVVLSAPHLSCELVLQSAGAGKASAAASPVRLPLASRAALADACEKLARSGARVMIIERSPRVSVHTVDPDGHALELYTGGEPVPTGAARPRALALADLQAPA
jgi:catechol-2,3-dioxygenase